MNNSRTTAMDSKLHGADTEISWWGGKYNLLSVILDLKSNRQRNFTISC